MGSLSIQKRKNKGKPRIVWQRYLGTAERVLGTYEQLDNLKLSLKTYDFGGVAAMLSVAEELGFKDIVTRATGDPEAWKHYLLMVPGRFTKSKNKNKTVEWFRETFLPMYLHSFKPYRRCSERWSC